MSADSTSQVLYPIVTYNDPDRAIEWLVQSFGMKIAQLDRSEDGSVSHAELSFNGAILMLGTNLGDHAAHESKNPDPRRSGIYLYVDNIDELFTRCTEAGVEFMRHLQETDYGSREFSAVDLEDNGWHFGTYRP
jgi:uncharacterized glyoxalase superfamily protein PhnB